MRSWRQWPVTAALLLGACSATGVGAPAPQFNPGSTLPGGPPTTPWDWRPNASTDFRYQRESAGHSHTSRKALAATAVGGTFGAMGLWSYYAWYAGQTKGDFLIARERWFDGRTYAGGADKLGHAFANYIMTRIAAQELQWGGYSATTSALTASALTLAFFVGIEVKDGYHKGFGFSRGDIVSDLIGIGLANAMLWSPRLDELLDFRMSYFPSMEFAKRLVDGNIDVGEDYSGMDFGLWLHLGSLSAVQKQPRWWAARFVDVGVGYATRGFLPLPDDPGEQRSRQLYVGITANLAAVLDAWLFDYGRRNTLGRGSVRRLAEFATLPFSTWKLGPEWTDPQP
jgi:hypothetical protein